MTRFAVSITIIVAVFPCFAAEPKLPVTLTVTDYAGVERKAEPVTSGVPLPESAGVTDPKQFRIIDSKGKEVPSQMRVLSRWGPLADTSKPIRWVLVDIQADVAAGGKSEYRLENKPSTPLKSLLVGRTDTSLSIHMSGMDLWINFRSPFRQLHGCEGVRVIGSNGVEYSTSHAAPSEVVLEYSGPLRVVIRVRGDFRSKDGRLWMGGNTEPELRRKVDLPWRSWYVGKAPPKDLRPITYTARLTYYRNKSQVRLDFTLENEGNSFWFLPGNDMVGLNDVVFKGLYFDFAPLNMQEVILEGLDLGRAGLRSARLVQRHRIKDSNNDRANFLYEIVAGDRVVASGKRARGWAEIGIGSGRGRSGFTLVCETFWEDYPKSIEIDPKEIRVGLWPELKKPDEWGQKHHVFAHGWHKTHSFLLDFHKGKRSAKQAEAVSKRFRSPLFAACPPEWYAATRAWGMIGPKGIKVADAKLQEAVERYETERRGMIDPKASANGRDMRWIRERYRCYGWQYYGAFFKKPDAGCSVLHYDWPMSAWLHFMRTGERGFFNEARIMTRHSIDLDQWHVANDPWHDGQWMWEGAGGHYPGKRPFHVSHNNGAAQCYTHTWSGGYALGYLLTGNRRHFEALERTLKGSRHWWWKIRGLEKGPAPYDQTRSQGWTILHHLYMYRITGERKWIDGAWTLFEKSLLLSEYKKSGAWPSGSKKQIVQTFHIYPIEPCVELHYDAMRAGIDVKPLTEFLKRWCDYTSTRFCAPPETTADGKYLPWRNEYSQPPDGTVNAARATSLHFNVMTCSAFAYLGHILKESDPEAAKKYTRIGREMFRDRYLYGPSIAKRWRGPPEAVDPAYRNPINFLSWIGQHEKTQGWALRGSQPLLWTLMQESDGDQE